MCGVIGFYTKKKEKEQIDLLYKLIIQSKIRGKHSFGYSFFDKGKIKTIKTCEFPDRNWLYNFENSQSQFLIYHNRYSTSGDWNNMDNNQPITIGDISLAMNGVTSMDKKENYESKFGIKCETDNDSEIFVQLLSQNNHPKITLERIGGSFAGCFFWQEEVWALRNKSRPLYWFKYCGAVYVCSTKDIAERAGIKNAKELEVNQLLCLAANG